MLITLDIYLAKFNLYIFLRAVESTECFWLVF